jgi:hypothetical protein
MIQQFEGERQAREYAETSSKKLKDVEFTLVKSMAGGINYKVYNDKQEVPKTDKVLFKYKNGEIVK